MEDGKRARAKRRPAGAGRAAAALEKVDERLVDRWVADLRGIVVAGQIDLLARVGEYLIQNVYGGIDEARSRRPDKPASLRRLAERAGEFGMKPTGLVRAVPMALQVRELGRPLASRLGTEQHRALLPVRNPAEKRVLAEAAIEAGWSAAELRQKVRRIQKPHAGGRSPQPALSLFVERADRLAAQVTPKQLRDSATEIDPREARRLLGRVNALQALFERVESMLVRALTPPK